MSRDVKQGEQQRRCTAPCLSISVARPNVVAVVCVCPPHVVERERRVVAFEIAFPLFSSRAPPPTSSARGKHSLVSYRCLLSPFLLARAAPPRGEIAGAAAVDGGGTGAASVSLAGPR